MSTPQFELISGSLCLDFANTVHNSGASDPGDDLSGYHDLLSWAEQAGILTRSATRMLASGRYPDHFSILSYAKKTRECVYAVFSAVAAGKKPPQPALAHLNSVLKEAMPHLSLQCSHAEFDWKWDNVGDPRRFIMWNVAYSAAKLLTSDQARRVRECSGSSCTWLFLDKSKNGSRRWCDMKNCGNREKSRRHYAKVKQGLR
jgi:predicted RNA-binding Zn ribbon-like protein